MKYAILLLLCVCSCAKPDVVYQPVSVDKPVYVKCTIPIVEAPHMPTQNVNSSMFVKVRTLIEENELRKYYETQLIAGNKACN